MQHKVFYVKTENGNTAHVLGDINMSEETANALNKLIDAAYKTGLSDLNKTQQSNMPSNQNDAQAPKPEVDESLINVNREKQRPLTFGEKLVGLEFNPSGDQKVNKAKRLCADLADLLHDEMKDREASEHTKILEPFAYGEILNAQMEVVKLLTFKY